MPVENSDRTLAVETRAARIDALATLPLFFKLAGKRVVVAGGSDGALWKAELLAAAGAYVDVFADVFADGFDLLTASTSNGRVKLIARHWRQDDLKGASIAVGGITDDEEAAAFATAARACGATVNVIDRPEFCDFQFGAIVNRSPLVVGISTDGAAPVLGQAIRSLVEGLLPQGLKRWVEAAKNWRREGERLGATMAERRRFWDRFAELAMRQSSRAPTQADLVQLLSPNHSLIGGNVTIVTVGALGTEALTLGAIRALRGSDCIFHDPDVPVEILEFARREADRTLSGCSEAETVVAPMINAAAKGKRIVRLIALRSAGDERATLEADALRTSGLAVVVIGSG